MDALKATLKERAAEYEVVAQRRDTDGPMVDRALEIVRQFIVDRRLILFGGLAIDYALRLKGGHIYPDDERPDFDFLSPRSVDDAYDLAELLAKQGFAGVGVVRGIHVQTMKVKTDAIWVADVGYAPPDAYQCIPTLEYRGMRIMHPDYQRIDQHLAFCFPFNGPPREDVFHRWRKDLKRWNLYWDHYPIAPALEIASVKTRRVSAAVDLSLAAVHGFAAYAVLCQSLAPLALSLGVPLPAPSFPVLGVEVGGSVSADLPEGVDQLVFASPWPRRVLPDGQARDPYMDVYPASVSSGSVVVLSTEGRLLAASRVRLGAVGGARAKKAEFVEEPNLSFQVVSPQYLLLYFLFQSHAGPEPTRLVYRSFYAWTLAVLRQAEELVAGSTAPDKMALFAESPFAPTTQTIGDVNHDAAYIVKMAGIAEKVKDTPPPELHLPENLSSLLVGLPQNYYLDPGRPKPRPVFDYLASPLFQRSGKVRE